MDTRIDSVQDTLRIDAAATANAIVATLRHDVSHTLRRYGLVVAISGGIDSAVCAGLAAEAFGPKRVLGIALPERESDPDSVDLARRWALKLGIDFEIEDITPSLTASRSYERRDDAIARITPYGPGWQSKLVLEDGVPGRLPVSYIATRSPEGIMSKVRLPAREFLEIVAATNYKQRVRAMHAYYHADRLRYAVCGTPNRLEYDLGFFVKGGDGLADVKPIAHLYKSQVYQLADHLGVLKEIRYRQPTTDTYSLPQSQEEFFFSLPLAELDVVLQACNEGRSAEAVASDIGRPLDHVRRAFQAIASKQRASSYLHAAPLVATELESTSAAATGVG
jgi:NAD+ synthase